MTEVFPLRDGVVHCEDVPLPLIAQGIGTLAAAFYPREVILRFSDFKTNEYAHLLGGELFEPHEANPMLGWRGASRYYHPDYKEGFLLELAAVRRVREQFGLTNLKVMVPFCRTPEEGRRVLAVMKEGGLERGRDGLEVYVMAELPANIWAAEAFAALFDGFSIGSNDLTQLTLGLDRDSERVAPLFDERDPAVERACALAGLDPDDVRIAAPSPLEWLQRLRPAESSESPAAAAVVAPTGPESVLAALAASVGIAVPHGVLSMPVDVRLLG